MCVSTIHEPQGSIHEISDFNSRRRQFVEFALQTHYIIADSGIQDLFGFYLQKSIICDSWLSKVFALSGGHLAILPQIMFEKNHVHSLSVFSHLKISILHHCIFAKPIMRCYN